MKRDIGMVMLQSYVVKGFLRAFESVQHGSIEITIPGLGSRHFGGDKPGVGADLVIHDVRAIMAFAQKGDIGFAESYRNGWWESQSLEDLLLFGLQNEAYLDAYIYGHTLSRIASRLSYLFTRNTLKGSKKNIHQHYDLGNAFYALWLDPSMTYSSALFHDHGECLMQAQYRKYDRILERLSSSGSLLEIGCGWGGFAERAQEKGDYGMKCLTLSESQKEYAQNRLGDRAVVSLEDYRHQKGTYDQIVSIEMFEAVGEKYWPIYFSKVKSLLAKKGKALIQTITIKDQYFERYRQGGDFIRTFIFPGGMLPSPERFKNISQQEGLVITDQFAFGKNYALTLKRWLKAFEEKQNQVLALGFDEPFIRMWRFYLSCCIASFTSGRTDVVQMELEHAA